VGSGHSGWCCGLVPRSRWFGINKPKCYKGVDEGFRVLVFVERTRNPSDPVIFCKRQVGGLPLKVGLKDEASEDSTHMRLLVMRGGWRAMQATPGSSLIRGGVQRGQPLTNANIRAQASGPRAMGWTWTKNWTPARSDLHHTQNRAATLNFPTPWQLGEYLPASCGHSRPSRGQLARQSPDGHDLAVPRRPLFLHDNPSPVPHDAQSSKQQTTQASPPSSTTRPSSSAQADGTAQA
jgi:hypothetical protein